MVAAPLSLSVLKNSASAPGKHYSLIENHNPNYEAKECESSVATQTGEEQHAPTPGPTRQGQGQGQGQARPRSKLRVVVPDERSEGAFSLSFPPESLSFPPEPAHSTTSASASERSAAAGGFALPSPLSPPSVWPGRRRLYILTHLAKKCILSCLPTPPPTHPNDCLPTPPASPD